MPHIGGSHGAQGSLWGRGDGRPKGGWVWGQRAPAMGVCWGRGSPSSPGLGLWFWGAYGAEVSLWGWEAKGGWAWGRSTPIWGSYGAGLSRVPPGGGGQEGLGLGCPTQGAAVGHRVLFGVVAMGDPRVDGLRFPILTGFGAVVVGRLWGRSASMGTGSQWWMGLGSQRPTCGAVMGQGSAGWWSGGFGVGVPHMGGSCGVWGSLWGCGDGRPKGGWVWGRRAHLWGGYGAGGLLGSGLPILTRFGAVVVGHLWGRSVPLGMGTQWWMGLGSQRPHMGQLWGRAQPGAAGGQQGVGKVMLGGVWGSGCPTWGAAVGHGVLFGVVGMGDPRVDGSGFPILTGFGAVVLGRLWGSGSPFEATGTGSQGRSGLGSQRPP